MRSKLSPYNAHNTCVFGQYTSQDAGYSSKESIKTQWVPATKSKDKTVHFISTVLLVIISSSNMPDFSSFTI